MAERGARTDEYLAAMLAIWREELPVYEGRFVTFAGVQAHPRRQIPVVIGGHSPAAYRRAIASGNGWYGFNLTPADAAMAIAGLREAAERTPRPAALGELEISVTPRGAVDGAAAADWAALGVDRLILMPPRHLNGAELLRYVEQVGTTLIG